MRIEATEEGAALDIETEELGDIAMGIGITADPQEIDTPQEQAVEQATSTATAQEPVVGEAGAPTASLSTSLVRKFMKSTGMHSVEPSESDATNLGQGLGANPTTAATPQTPTPIPLVPNSTMTPDEVTTRIENAQSYTWSDSDSHQMNFDTLPDDEISNIVGTLADGIASKVNEQRRGEMADEALYEMAGILRADPVFMEKVLKMEPGTALAPEEMLAAKQMMILTGQDLSSMSKNFAGMSAEEQGDFGKRIAVWEQMYGKFMGARAESGRSLRVHGIDPQVGDASLDIDNMAMALQQTQNGVNLQGRADAIGMADDVRGVAQIIEATAPNAFQKGFDVAYEVFINGILSGVKTHVINFTGSSIRTGVNVFDTAVAGLFGGGAANPAEVIARDEWKAQMFALSTGFRNALTVAGKTMKTAEKYGDVDKMDAQFRDPVITGDNLGGGKVTDWIGNIIRAPTERLMGGTDAFNKYMAESMSLGGQAWSRAKAQQKQFGLTDDETEAVLLDLIENPTVEMKVIAKEDGKMMTFQEDLGDWGKKGQEWIAGNRGAKLIVPFYKTPANLLKQGFLERTPLGMVTKKFRDDVRAGGRRRQMAMSKMTTGTMLTTGLVTMSANGMITGHYSKDPDIRKAQQLAGWEPMSIVINNDDGSKTYIPMDRLEPFSYLFGMAADLGAIYRYGQMRDLTDTEMDKYTEMAGMLVVAIGENTLNKSFMTGVRGAMDAVTKGGGYATNWVKNTANAFTPYSGLRRNIEGLISSDRKRTDGIVEDWKERMLIFQTNAAPLVDGLGRDVKKEHIYIPWDLQHSEEDPVAIKLLEMTSQTGQSAVRSAPKTMHGVPLTAKQQYRFMKLSRTQEFRDELKETMSSKGFEDMWVGDQIKQIRETTARYDEGAKAILLDEDPSLMRKVLMQKNQSIARRMAHENGGDPKDLLNKLVDEGMQDH